MSKSRRDQKNCTIERNSRDTLGRRQKKVHDRSEMAEESEQQKKKENAEPDKKKKNRKK